MVDGDTIRVRLDGRTERVRYIGVDTPESVKPGTPVQCYAKRAAAANAALVAGRSVRLVGDVEQRDRYGRLLAYVYREPDGAFVNAQLVRDGYARTLTIAPNVAHAHQFAQLAQTARGAAAGYGAPVRWGRFLVPPMASTKLQQSLAAFERAFVEEAEADRLRRERIYREAEQRLDTRRRERVHKHGSMRFVLLVLVLLATAALVTVAMFKTLYVVMG